MAKGETATKLTLARDKVVGELFLPPVGTPRHAGVLVFGGADGGMSQVYGAALLAAHGYPALTVAYFDWPGLPSALDEIPLEYFETAGRSSPGSRRSTPPTFSRWATRGAARPPSCSQMTSPRSSTGRSCTRRHRR
jgi:hypothetical protein